MELTLYRRYAEAILAENHLDPFGQRKIQELIEAYSRDLGLDDERLGRIEQAVAAYGRLTGTDVRLRYYQVLALYFTQHFFDEKARNEATGGDARKMLAYWMATGSGKTLVMHLNVLQYLAYLQRTSVDFDRLQLVLTTPGLNLIEQHRRELEPFVAALNEDYGGRLDLTVDTTQALLQHEDDYWRLPDDGRTRRLVLVDEAHVGLGTTTEGEFKRLRDRLGERHAFLFEYSATYHNLGPDVQAGYGEAIVFDYNYARFFKDGYGKDYYFKVVGEDTVDTEEDVRDNLGHCFAVTEAKIAAWNHLAAKGEAERVRLYGTTFPPRPLIAFMGNTVEDPRKAGKETSDDEVSDIKKVVRYLARLAPEERGRFRSVFNGDVAGPLVVTRSPSADDELLLSYGEGAYWGIVNVGNAGSFFAGLDEDALGIVKQVRPLVPGAALFRNLERPESPINVLIGSRKFAEGWNSFRVGVIGLINLGKSKGNKIIQIFGRGVRLHGHDGDGRRHDPAHHGDYFALGEDEADRLRRLETLVVLSLKSSYLSTFVESVQEEVPPATTFSIRVNPAVFRLDGGEEITFSELRKRLPVFKLRGTRTDIKRVVLRGGTIKYEYLEDGKPIGGQIDTYRVPRLDYRTDKDEPAVNVVADLRAHVRRLGAFMDRAGLERHIRQRASAAKLLLLAGDDGDDGQGDLRVPTFPDLLALVDEVRYRGHLLAGSGFADIGLLDKLAWRISEDVIAKVKNRVNYVINQRNYLFDEPLRQQDGPRDKGDVLYQYAVTRTFESAEALAAFEANLEQERAQIRTLLALNRVAGPDGPHLYAPLLDEQEARANPALSVKPDLLNPGEKKFIEDLAAYARETFPPDGNHELYVLRNVESLKSVGVFLEDDEGGYFPDFVVWVIKKETGRTSVLLVDPKGQRGMTDDFDPTQMNEKVRLGQREEGGTLRMLDEALTKAWERPVEVHSFVLLRDTSKMGKGPNQGAAWAREHMLPYNLLRLDWHGKDEEGHTSVRHGMWDGLTYLDFLFAQAGVHVGASSSTRSARLAK